MEEMTISSVYLLDIWGVKSKVDRCHSGWSDVDCFYIVLPSSLKMKL